MGKGWGECVGITFIEYYINANCTVFHYAKGCGGGIYTSGSAKILL